MPVIGQLANRSIPCLFLLSSASQDTDLVACISQATLSTGFWLGLDSKGTHSRLEGRRRGKGRVFLPFSFFSPTASISDSGCVSSMAPTLSRNSGCTLVLQASPLSSKSYHIPWFLGSNDATSPFCLLFQGLVVLPAVIGL